MLFLLSYMFKRAVESDVDVPVEKRRRTGQSPQKQIDSGASNFAQRAITKIIEFVQRPLSVQNKKKPVVKQGLFEQPAEVLYMIIENLTLEEMYHFTKSSKVAKSFVEAFHAKLKYEWTDSLFKRLKTHDERARNCYYLLVAIHSALKSKQHNYTKLIDWLDVASHKCPNLPMPLIFEMMLKSWDVFKTAKVVKPLIKRWMTKDALQYVTNFPLGVDSSDELKAVESRLLKNFRRVLSDSLHLPTKIYLFTLLLRSLAELSDVYKLLYLFCVPRVEGSVDFEYYGTTHPDDHSIDFGNLVTAFKLMLNTWHFPVASRFSSRDVFVVLEDLTTLPVIWSMHTFVKFLLLNHDLCVLSTYIRFVENYHDDAASTFYYCIRIGTSVEFLESVTNSIIRRMSPVKAQLFVDALTRKSSEAIAAADLANVGRLVMLHTTHLRLLDCLTAGLKQYLQQCKRP